MKSSTSSSIVNTGIAFILSCIAWAPMAFFHMHDSSTRYGTYDLPYEIVLFALILFPTIVFHIATQCFKAPPQLALPLLVLSLLDPITLTQHCSLPLMIAFCLQSIGSYCMLSRTQPNIAQIVLGMAFLVLGCWYYWPPLLFAIFLGTFSFLHYRKNDPATTPLVAITGLVLAFILAYHLAHTPQQELAIHDSIYFLSYDTHSKGFGWYWLITPWLLGWALIEHYQKRTLHQRGIAFVVFATLAGILSFQHPFLFAIAMYQALFFTYGQYWEHFPEQRQKTTIMLLLLSSITIVLWPIAWGVSPSYFTIL